MRFTFDSFVISILEEEVVSRYAVFPYCKLINKKLNHETNPFPLFANYSFWL